MKIEILETDKSEVNASKVVSEAEWLVARKDLLTREKELTRLRDEVSRHRRELPWVKVKKQYVFDGPNGQETLTDLFDSRSQLIVYHFMFGPDWEEGLQELLVSGGPFRWRKLASPASRRFLRCHLSRAVAETRSLQKANGLAVQVVVVLRQRFQF